MTVLIAAPHGLVDLARRIETLATELIQIAGDMKKAAQTLLTNIEETRPS